MQTTPEPSNDGKYEPETDVTKFGSGEFALIGVGVGIGFTVIICLYLGWWCYKKKKAHKQNVGNNEEPKPTEGVNQNSLFHPGILDDLRINASIRANGFNWSRSNNNNEYGSGSSNEERKSLLYKKESSSSYYNDML